MTPELQEILNKQIALQGKRSDITGGLAGRMEQEFGQQMDFSGLNPMAGTPLVQYTMPENYEGVSEIGDPTAMRQRAEDAYYNKASSRLDPQYAEQRRAMEQKMRNQGLGPEDAAWQNQMKGIGQAETDAYGQATYDSIRAGLGEQSQSWTQGLQGRQQGIGERNDQFSQALSSNAQNFGQNMQTSNYANQIRQQQLTEAMQQRGFSLNEINALLNGQQVNTPQMPNFNTASAATPAPVYQGGVDQGNADQAGLQNIMNLAGGVGNAAATYYGMGG